MVETQRETSVSRVSSVVESIDLSVPQPVNVALHRLAAACEERLSEWHDRYPDEFGIASDPKYPGDYMVTVRKRVGITALAALVEPTVLLTPDQVRWIDAALNRMDFYQAADPTHMFDRFQRNVVPDVLKLLQVAQYINTLGIVSGTVGNG